MMKKKSVLTAALIPVVLFFGAIISARAEEIAAGVGADAVAVNKAETAGRVKDGLARFNMKLSLSSYSDAEARTTLLPPQVAVTDWSAGRRRFRGPDVYVARTHRGIELISKGEGDFEVELEFVLPAAGDARGRSSLSVPMIGALVASTEIVLPGKELEVNVNPEVSMETTVRDENTVVTFYGGRETVTLVWREKEPIRVLEPVVFANQTLRAAVGHGVLRLDATIDYSVVQDGIERLVVKFPDDCSLLEIDGRHIRSWDVEGAEDGTQFLSVELAEKVRGHYALELTFEKVLPQVEMEVELPAIEPLGVVRENGQVAVSAASGIRVEAYRLEGISHMDVREIEGVSAERLRQLRLGFRYLKRPFTLVLRVGEVQPKTSAEVLTLVRAGMDALRLDSRLNYTVRDAGVFEFKIALEEGLRLVDIDGENINNWQFDETGRELTVSLRSQAKGEYRLGIETELSAIDPQNVRVPAIHAVGVEREVGYVAVRPGSGMKVETEEAAGLSQIDLEGLPAPLRERDPAVGFRYIRPGYDLVINVSEIEPEVQAEVQSIYTLTDHALQMQTEIRYSIRRAGIFQLRVAIPEKLRRTSIEGEGIDDTSYDAKSGILTVNLRSMVSGDYVLRLGLEKGLTLPRDEIEIPVIETVNTRKERGFIAVVARASVRVKPAEEAVGGLDSVGVSDLPPQMLRRADTVALAFKYFARPWRLALGIEPIEPRVTAEVFNLLTVGEELLSVSATARYSIANAGVDRLKVILPGGASAVEFDGDGIKHRQKGEDGETWTIALQSRMIGDYTLYVSFQIALPGDQILIPYTGVATPDVHRETGYLAVTSRPEVELQVADQDVEGLTPVDGREIPEVFTEGLEDVPLLLAYRYISHPYMLHMSALPHGAAEVTVAVVETARLSTTVTEEGNMITDLVCELRNTRQQYLDLRLPDGARTWHAFVDSEPVTPLRDGDVIKIPVAGRDGSGQARQEVRLRYSHGRDALGRRGGVRLDCPLADIDVMRLGWTLSLPEGFKIVRDSGPIRRIEGVHAMEARLRRLDPDSEVATAVQRRLSDDQLKSRQAAFNIRALEQSEVRDRQPAGRRSALYTGARPGEANIHAFQALIVSRGEPAWLQIDYLRGTIDMPLKGLFVLLLAAACAGVWKAGRGGAMLWKTAALYAASLLALALRVLLEGAYHDYLSVAVYTLAAAATVMLVHTTVCGAVELRRSLRAR